MSLTNSHGGFSDTVTEKDEAAAKSRPTRFGAQLYVVFQCTQPRAGGSRHALADVSEVRIGRGDPNATYRGALDGRRTLLLRIPDPHLSADHARLMLEGEQWRIVDRQSRNGTFVGDRPIDEAVLEDGALVQCGRTFFRLRTRQLIADEDPSDVYSSRTVQGPRGLASLLSPLRDKYSELERVSQSNIPVLIAGETGTGKGVVAAAIHTLSGRAGQLCAVNCGALPPALFESELFGHKRGAFSGAVADSKGLARAAEGGTLFLDEVAELQLQSQAALLQFLQDMRVRPVGAERSVPVDARVISATNADLLRNVDEGRFREDLHARLAAYVVSLPPLRDRIEDLGVLTAELLARHAEPQRRIQFSAAAGRALMRTDWPQNIRQLEHVIRRALALCNGDLVEHEHLQLEHQFERATRPRTTASGRPRAPSHPNVMSEKDADLASSLERLLAEHRGNISEVARVTGKARMQIQRWVRRFGLDPERFREGH